MKYVALLRAIGPQTPVSTEQFRGFFTDLGYGGVASLLRTGNLIFDARGGDAVRLEKRLEQECEKRLKLRTDFMVRTAPEWSAVVAANPFQDAARDDPAHLVVMFLKAAPDEAAVAALRAAIVGRESVHVRGREAYLTYPDGIAGSRLTNALLERKLGTRSTFRNWNTVMKVAALVAG